MKQRYKNGAINLSEYIIIYPPTKKGVEMANKIRKYFKEERKNVRSNNI